MAAISLLLGPILCARLCQLSDTLARSQSTLSAAQILALHHAGIGHSETAREQPPADHRHSPLAQMRQLMLGVTEALPRIILLTIVFIALAALTCMQHLADDQHSPRVPLPPPRVVALLSS